MRSFFKFLDSILPCSGWSYAFHTCSLINRLSMEILTNNLKPVKLC